MVHMHRSHFFSEAIRVQDGVFWPPLLLRLEARMQIPGTWLLSPGSEPLFHTSSLSKTFAMYKVPPV